MSLCVALSITGPVTREATNALLDQLVLERALVKRVPLIVLRDHQDDCAVVSVGLVCGGKS